MPEDRSSRPLIGLLINNIGYYAYSICQGAVQAADRLGVNACLFTLTTVRQEIGSEIADSDVYGIDELSIANTLTQIESMSLDGLIINSDVLNFINPNVITDFKNRNPELRLITMSTRVPGCTLVATDNYQSSYNAVDYLIKERGRSHVAYLRAPVDSEEGNQRFNGYVDAINKNGLEFKEELVVQCDWFLKSGMLAVKHLLDNKIQFDAIAGGNDNVVEGATQELINRNLNYKQDVSVIGFDNNLYSQAKGFSTIEQPYDLLSEAAVEELVAQINLKKVNDQVLMPGILINRDSNNQKHKMVGRYVDSDFDKSSDCLDRLIKSRSYLNFLSNQSRRVFFEDLKNFWKTLLGVMNPKESYTQTNEELSKYFSQILQRQINESIDVSPWVNILNDLSKDTLTVIGSIQKFQNLFSDLIELAGRSSEQVNSQIRQKSESLNFDLMVMGQKLMSAQTYMEMAEDCRHVMLGMQATHLYIGIYDQDEPMNEIENTELYGLLSPGEDYLTTPYSLSGSQKDIKDALEPVLKRDQCNANHFLVSPLGVGGNMTGFVLATLSDNLLYWPVYRAIQTYLTQAIYSINQINANKKSEQRANRANAAKGEFLSRMTHELRTPMNGVIAMTSLLLDTDLTDEQTDFVSTIRNSGDALLNQINEILDYSKIEANKLSLEPTDFNLIGCIEEAIDLVSAIALQKQIKLQYTLASDVPIWHNQDSSRIRQVLVNLLSNSMKFTESGFIRIEVKLKDNNKNIISISVKDTGIGLTKSQGESLFQPFVQADNNIHRNYGGTGLGLVISQKICNAMNGDLVWDSEYLGGACFRMHVTTSQPLVSNELLSWELPLNNKHINQPKLTIISEDKFIFNLLYRYADQWGIEINYLSSDEFSTSLVFNGHKNEVYFFDCLEEHADMLLSMHLDKLQNASFIFSLSLKTKNKFPNLPANIKTLPTPAKISSIHHALQRIYRGQQYSSNSQQKIIQANFALQYPMKILLAEDNVVNQKVAKTILSKFGYRIDVVANGKEAVEACTLSEYDVILMDVLMPELDGTEATKIIRNRFEKSIQPYIIAVTANAQSGDREVLLEAGMDDYLSKPLKIPALIKALEKAFEQKS